MRRCLLLSQGRERLALGDVCVCVCVCVWTVCVQRLEKGVPFNNHPCLKGEWHDEIESRRE